MSHPFTLVRSLLLYRKLHRSGCGDMETSHHKTNKIAEKEENQVQSLKTLDVRCMSHGNSFRTKRALFLWVVICSYVTT